MKYWANDTFTPSPFHPLGRGRSHSPTSHQPRSLCLTTTTFLSKPLIPFPPTPILTWPFCDLPSIKIPDTSLPAPSFPSLLSLIRFSLSFLPPPSLTLGCHFLLSALCVQSIQLRLVPGIYVSHVPPQKKSQDHPGTRCRKYFLAFSAFFCHSLSSALSGHMSACLSSEQAPVPSVLKKTPFPPYK